MTSSMTKRLSLKRSSKTSYEEHDLIVSAIKMVVVISVSFFVILIVLAMTCDDYDDSRESHYDTTINGQSMTCIQKQTDVWECSPKAESNVNLLPLITRPKI
jgi:hypothetical protein